MKKHRDRSKVFFLVYLQLAMKKHKDCTVPAQNCSQFPLTFGEGQQINSHFRSINCLLQIVTYIMRYAIPVIVIQYMC